MINLILMTISYGALLIMLMPKTMIGIISTSAVFVTGLILIVHKKVYRRAFLKSNPKFFVSIATVMAICLGILFYTRWVSSSKIKVLADILHMPTELMLFVGSLLLVLISVYFIVVGLQIIFKRLSNNEPQNGFQVNLKIVLIVAAATVVLSQFMINASILSMGCLKLCVGILIVSVVILLCYSLSGRIVLSNIIGSGIFMVISTINVYVYNFRERLFAPADVFSVGTGLNVAENYSLFPIPLEIFAGWGFYVAMMTLFYPLLRKFFGSITVKRRILVLVACIICSTATSFYAHNIKTYHWQNEGAVHNGYILDFVSKFKEIYVPEPENYSVVQIKELADQYALIFDENKVGKKKPPHIIVIMDEAYSDLRVNGNFSTNTEVTPFISSLKENTVSGYALASVYGGNTANSEYEFLTGNSFAYLAPDVVPYQQYIKSSAYSMVSYLRSTYNYKCIAMHPFNLSGWNRPVAYKYLGFEECYFLDDFPQEEYIREYVSDQEMFETLIKTYETNKDAPLFIFGVTMQNHGGYNYTGENYTQHICLTDYEDFLDVEQYLSLIYETDKAVEYLLSYFQNVGEDVIVVFFGDHQPKIDEAFYETISETPSATLDEQENRYKVPFFIWSNYDIEEKYINCTSLNYLSNFVYDIAGIDLPPYNRFLSEMQSVIPSINANGFYSLDAKCYLPFEKANIEEQRWLGLYENLQYNNIFDETHRNEKMFPVLEEEILR